MQITQINSNSQIYTPKINSKAFKTTKMPYDNVSFKGHLGSETIVRNGAKLVLKHETALFRDLQTKTFVKDYILKNFSDKPNIKMIIGACSSGEEAFSYSMLLDSLKQKLSIIGFDISKKSIDEAKSGKVLMQATKGKSDNYISSYTAFDKESFLCFDTKTSLNAEQIEQKRLFDEFFEITSKVSQTKVPLSYKIQRWIFAKLFNRHLPIFINKEAKIKDGKFANCTFKEGDISNLTSIVGTEKADVITFSNAMYHLTTNDIANGMLRAPKENSEEIVREIAVNVKKNLNPNGIFVLGENEIMQMMDQTTIPKVFKELGFEPLNKTEEHFENVWRLIK